MKIPLNHSTVRARVGNTVLDVALLLVCGLTFAALVANGVISFTCPSRWLLGLECPGCGSTRAALSLMRLDVAAAFSFNLLWPVEYGYILWVYAVSVYQYIRYGHFRYTMPFKPLDITVAVLIIGWGILRNVFFFDAEVFAASMLMKAWQCLQFIIGVIL